MGAASISKNGRYLAYSVDSNGSERFTARIKDLETGELLADEIPETLSGLTWVANDTMIAYGKANENWRVNNVRLHRLGTEVSDDVEIYTEEDISFRVGSGLSAQDDWLIISTGDNETSEIRLVRADDPTGEQILISARQKVESILSTFETMNCLSGPTTSTSIFVSLSRRLKIQGHGRMLYQVRMIFT